MQSLDELTYEVKTLSSRFDHELGAADGSYEGSVKKHICQIQADVAEIKSIIVGDGKSNLGLAHVILTTATDLKEHKDWDRWLFMLLFSSQVLGLYKLFR